MKRRRHKSRPSGESFSSDLSGEKASPDLQGPDEGYKGNEQQQQKNGGGDVPPTHSEGIAARPRRRRQRIPEFDSFRLVFVSEQQQHNAFRMEDFESSADPPTPLMKGASVEYKTQQKKITSAAHKSHSSSSVEEQEEASFDEEETSTEKEQPEPSSGDGNLSKITQDEDEHSGTKPSSEGFNKIIALDEDKQNSDAIGVHGNQDQTEGEGGAGGHGQSLLNVDNDTLMKQISDYFDRLSLFHIGPTDGHENWYENCYEYTPQQQTELYERLAFYRIRGYELSVDGQLPSLDDAYLKVRFSPADLLDNGYFKYYEKSLEWYFDLELCWDNIFDDYQRLVLRDYGEYYDWNCCLSIRNTCEQDLAYVKYWEVLTNKTKWIEDYLVHRTVPWRKIEDVALLEALEVAATLQNVPKSLVYSGLKELLWNIDFDYGNYKGMDDVYYEIWKRVSKQNMDFTNALSEIHRQNMFPFRSFDIEHELKNNPIRFSMQDNYKSHVACIDETASEDEARMLIKEAVLKMRPRPKAYVDYARKKLDIAKDIGLVPKG